MSEPSPLSDDAIRAYNRQAWDCEVERGNPWTLPVDAEAVAQARRGELELLLTPSRPVPRDWYPPLKGASVLCLASGGGQQGPLLAAAGAHVTVLDNSPQQLQQDREVAQREGLQLQTVEGDMADLSAFVDGTFDLIFHPCSNCFVPAVKPVWRECHRVLKAGGVLLAGFINPVRYLFDPDDLENANLTVRYAIPYADITSLPPDECRRRYQDQLLPVEFGHTLEDQIGGQLEAGLVLTGFFEDRYGEDSIDPLSDYLATFIATRAVKPHSADALTR